MPQYVEVQGNVIEFPDGMAPADIEKAIKSNMGSIQPSATIQAGKAINDIPRQIGLTARYGLEGVANTAQIATEPLRRIVVDPLMRQAGVEGKTSRPLGEEATRLADLIGLPSPRGATERVVGDATRMVAGAGALGRLAQSAQQLPGMVGKAGEFLAANLPQQLTSAGGAGLAGGASREAGGSPLMQGMAAFGGSLLGATVPGITNNLVKAGKSLLNRPSPQELDQQISVLLQRADVDYSQLPGAARVALREDLSRALRAGEELNPEAVRRLADIRSVNGTPTRGMVSQDPVQITREMNLAKIAANTNDTQLHGLPRIQNENNTRLIQSLNNQGAASGDSFSAGQRAIGAIRGRDQEMQNAASALYQRARDTEGRSLPLNGAEFTRQANQALDEAMLGYALPPSVQTRLNEIATGRVPFTIDYAEQLKKTLNNLHGSTNDRAVQNAIGTVRRALDDAPLLPAERVNPGNLPSVPGTVPTSPMVAGRESLNAFDQARAAARERFQWRESGRPIEAALNGAEPDRFVQQFVVKGSLADARSVASNAPREDVRNAIASYLKEKALGGASDEVGKFSQSAYNKALNEIGDRKLALFFSPEEVAQLRAAGRAASYMQVQPVGSAVNNSNSGALTIGKAYDALMGLAERTPVIGPMVTPPMRNLEISIRNQQAQNIQPSLLAQRPQQPAGSSLLLPGLAFGGLLAAPNSQ